MVKRVPEHDRQKVYSKEDDTHDMLIKAYLEYYKHNETFEKRCSFRTYKQARRWLREVQHLSRVRQDEIINTFKAKKQAEKTKRDQGTDD